MYWRKIDIKLIALLLSLILFNIPVFTQNQLTEQKIKQINDLKEQAERSKSEGNKNQQANFYNKIAGIYWDNNSLNEALVYFKQSIELNQSIGNLNAVRVLSSYAGTINFDLGHYLEAINYYQKSLELNKKSGIKAERTSLLLSIATSYQYLHDYHESNKYLLQLIPEGVEQNDIKLLRNCYSMLVGNYEKLGQKQKSSEYHELFLALDQLNKDMEVKEITNKSQIEVARANSEIMDKDKKLKITTDSLEQSEKLAKERQLRLALLLKENEVNLEQRKRAESTRNFLITGLLIFLLFIIIVLYQYRQKKKANKELIKLNAEITEQNAQIEQQSFQLNLQNKELEKLSVVASKTDNAVVIADAQGYIEWANESFNKIWGCSIEEFKKTFGNTIIESSANPDIKEYYEQAVKQKKSVVYITHSFDKIGREFWTQTTLTPIFENDVLQKLITIDSDISKIKFAEKEITDSIHYAFRIQSALLPPPDLINSIIPENFILFRPRDVVSGDFYWVKEIDDFIYFAIGDCTGHGVPGAFMSILGVSFLNQIIKEKINSQPNEILNELRSQIKTALHLTGKDDEARDGMDIALCRIDKINKEIRFSGAFNSLIIIREDELLTIKGDRMPIGVHLVEKSFTNHEVQIQKGDMYYMMTDGFTDQYGKDQREKFKRNRLLNLLVGINQKPIKEQKDLMNTALENWKGNFPQLDDILVAGFRIS